MLVRHSPKGVHSTVQKEPRETAGGTLSEASCLNNAAKEENSSQVDLRVHGVPQDDFHKDAERVTEMRNLVDRVQDGYRDKSIIKDLKHQGVSNVFSEESNRKLREMGNIELYELFETVRTTQCHICLKHSKEGTIYCRCGKCSIPSQEHADKFQRRIDILTEPQLRNQARKTWRTPRT